jgi:hypothetical protein
MVRIGSSAKIGIGVKRIDAKRRDRNKKKRFFMGSP